MAIRPHYAGVIAHRKLFENALETRGIRVLLWTKNILKTDLFKNDDFIMFSKKLEALTSVAAFSNNSISLSMGELEYSCFFSFVGGNNMLIATWLPLDPCYENAHGCTQVVLPLVIGKQLHNIDLDHVKLLIFHTWCRNHT